MSGLMHRMKQVTLSSKSLLTTTKYSDHIQSLSKLVSHRFSYMMQHATMSNVAHVTVVSSIVYSMYQSMSLMTEIFLYDAKAGIRGMVDREETAQKIDHQLRQLLQLQSDMITFVSPFVGVKMNDTDTGIEKNGKSQSSFENISKFKSGEINQGMVDDSVLISQFDSLLSNYTVQCKELEALLAEKQEIVQEFIRNTMIDKEHYAQQEKKAYKSMIMGAVSTVSSVALSYLFPPASITHIPVVISSVTAGVNGALSWVAKNEKERMQYRIDELNKLNSTIVSARSQMEQFRHLFEKLKLERAEATAAAAAKATTTTKHAQNGDNGDVKGSNQMFKAIYHFFTRYTSEIVRYSLILVIFSFFMHVMSAQEHVTLMFSIKWAMALCFICLLCSFSVDIFNGVSRTKIALQTDRDNRAKVYSSAAQKQYKQECNWYELSTSRQIQLGMKALFWNVLLQDGSRAISINEKGELVSDPECIKLLAQSIANEQSSPLKSSPIETDAEIIAVTYANIVKGIFKPIVEAFANGIDTLIVSTTFTTKIWVMSTASLTFLLVVRRFLFCF